MTTARSRAAAAAILAGVIAGCGSQPRTATLPDALTQPTAPTPTASCSTQDGFELSLVSDRGGQSTPVRAAEWFARHGGLDVPRSGWRRDGSDSTGVFTRSGTARLHVVEGRDTTWQVDSGTHCG